MIEKFFERSVAEKMSPYSDDRAICLRTVFVDSMQASVEIAEKIYNDLMLPLNSTGMFGLCTDEEDHVKFDKLFETFKGEFFKWDEAALWGRYSLKTDKIKNKASLKRQEKRLLALRRDYAYEEKIYHDRLQRAEDYAKGFSGEDSNRAFVKALLHNTDHTPTSHGGTSDADIEFKIRKYSTKDDVYMSSLTLCIRYYSLGTNLNAAAEYLKSWLDEMASTYGCISGLVGKGMMIWQFAIPEMVYFSNCKDGLVRGADGYDYDSRDWLEVNYAEGIGWANVFSNKIADKVVDIERAKKLSDVEIIALNDGGISVCSKKQFTEFNSEETEELYPYFWNCLRPGSSTKKITYLDKNVHDLAIPEYAYEVDGEYVTFSRGNFDFITIPIEELFPVNEEQPYTVDYESIFRMLEDNFGAKCKLYGEAELTCDDISRMIVEARNRSVYPLVICAAAPVVDHLDDLSKSNVTFEKLSEDETEIIEGFQYSKDIRFRSCINKIVDENYPLLWIESKISPVKLLRVLGFDDCIQAPFAKISQNWYDEYGAVPTVIGFGEIEYMLKKPVPKSKAMKLAIEHFEYASASFEVMDDLRESVLKYAHELTVSQTWRLEFI